MTRVRDLRARATQYIFLATNIFRNARGDCAGSHDPVTSLITGSRCADPANVLDAYSGLALHEKAQLSSVSCLIENGDPQSVPRLRLHLATMAVRPPRRKAQKGFVREWEQLPSRRNCSH